jgi:bifunctional DNA-binding transcriptional regulator/antitoxin component of YhaV-PrlF toxin-antitoxin module
MSTSYVMKVSRNGQVSIPADTRSRWRSERVVMVDLGDRIVVRPLPDDPVGSLRGKYAGVGSDSDESRRLERVAGADRERRR